MHLPHRHSHPGPLLGHFGFVRSGSLENRVRHPPAFLASARVLGAWWDPLATLGGGGEGEKVVVVVTDTLFPSFFSRTQGLSLQVPGLEQL